MVEQDASMEEELKLSGDLDDELLEMQFLFDDMRAMCLGLISDPQDAEEKTLVKAFRLDRTAKEKAAILKHKAEMAAEKALNKAARMASIDEDNEMKEN